MAKQKNPCFGNLQHSAEANSDKQRYPGACVPIMWYADLNRCFQYCPRLYQLFTFTSFSSGGLLCGWGHDAATLSSSSNSGTWNSEAESRSLLTAESVTRQDFGTKAGNGGSSLAPWKEKRRRKIWDRFHFLPGQKFLNIRLRLKIFPFSSNDVSSQRIL